MQSVSVNQGWWTADPNLLINVKQKNPSPDSQLVHKTTLYISKNPCIYMEEVFFAAAKDDYNASASVKSQHNEERSFFSANINQRIFASPCIIWYMGNVGV